MYLNYLSLFSRQYKILSPTFHSVESVLVSVFGVHVYMNVLYIGPYNYEFDDTWHVGLQLKMVKDILSYIWCVLCPYGKIFFKIFSSETSKPI
jgi:hypothetical protein